MPGRGSGRETRLTSQGCRGTQIGSFAGVRPISIEFAGQRAIATRLNKGQSSKSAKVRASSALSAATRHLSVSQLLSTLENQGFNSEMVIGILPAPQCWRRARSHCRELTSRAVRLGETSRSLRIYESIEAPVGAFPHVRACAVALPRRRASPPTARLVATA